METTKSHDFEALLTKVSGFPNIAQTTASDFGSNSNPFNQQVNVNYQMGGTLATHRNVSRNKNNTVFDVGNSHLLNSTHQGNMHMTLDSMNPMNDTAITMNIRNS